MMEKEVNSYSVFDIGTAAESLKTSSSENVHNSHGMKKGRRLITEQTRALEKSSQLGKILEAGRKEELAGALGLHPRQISIWFQNRRAKWKSAQLEKDFSVLKQNYGFLKAHYHILLEENKRLQFEDLPHQNETHKTLMELYLTRPTDIQNCIRQRIVEHALRMTL